MKTLLLLFCLLGFRADEISKIEIHKASFAQETATDVSCASFYHFGNMIDTFCFTSLVDKKSIIRRLNASKKMTNSIPMDVRAKTYVYHYDGKLDVVCITPTGAMRIGDDEYFLNTSLRDFIDSLKNHYEKLH